MTQSQSLPIVSDTISEADIHTLRHMYQPLVDAAVGTRRDLDQIAFRYIATLMTIATAIASNTVNVTSWSLKIPLSLLILVVVAVATYTLHTRNRVYCKINRSLVNIEAALGGFVRGRFVKDELLFNWGANDLYRQNVPHIAGLIITGVLCVAAVVVDSVHSDLTARSEPSTVSAAGR